MAQISYTSGWSLLHKIFLIAGNFAALAAAFTLTSALPLGWMPDWMKVVGGIAVFFGTLVLAPEVLTKTILPWWIPTWLYANVSLGIPVTVGEARLIGFLFDGSMPGGRWFPLTGFRKLDRAFRKEALFRFANHVCRDNGWVRPFPELDAEERRAESASQADSNRRADGAKTQSEREDVASSARTQLLGALALLGIEGVPATFDEVKLAYRKRVSQYHPDRFSGDKPEVLAYANEMTKRINSAFVFLERVYATGAVNAGH